jgi:hypothetical protein
MFDWAHLYVSDGLADVEFGEYMKAMHVATTQGGIGHTCTYSTLGDYLKGWKWPKSRGSPLHLFEPEKTKRFIKSGDFNCSASEFLSLAPLIKRFLERVVMPQVESIPGLRLKTESMIAVLKVLDILQKCKLKGAVTPDKLRTAIKTHLDLFKACHDVSDMRPKHHYVLHLPTALRLFGVLLTTLTHERKHRAAKRYARGRINLESFEVSVLEEMTAHNLWELNDKHWAAYTTAKPSIKQKWWLDELFPNARAEFTLHNEVYVNSYLTRGDIVTFSFEDRTCIGELLVSVGLAYDDHAEMVSLVSVWDYTLDIPGFATCTVKDMSVQIPTANLIAPALHRMSGDRTSCVVVLPCELAASE